MINGQVITLTLTSISGTHKTDYALSADGKSMTGDAGAKLDLKN